MSSARKSGGGGRASSSAASASSRAGNSSSFADIDAFWDNASVGEQSYCEAMVHACLLLGNRSCCIFGSHRDVLYVVLLHCLIHSITNYHAVMLTVL